MCTLNTVSTSPQTVAADGFVVFDINTVNGCCIKHAEGSTSVVIPKHGKYLIVFGADITPTAAGTVQLMNKLVAVPAAAASFTDVTESHIEFATIIDVAPSCRCANNTAILKVQSDVEVVMNNVSLSVLKVM